ncbi:MAG: hypothetical protein GW778_00980 [Alphaproteobacteria bacterium]|nr:hypothetical protein [Alphaproteobacteria bacterium]
MSDLLAEVDDAMRQERLAKFWHENKFFIVAFVVLTIVATGAMSAYRSWDMKTKTEQTAQLITLQEATNYPANIIEDDLDFRPSIRGIALLSAAGTAMQRNNQEDAAKLYARIVADTKIPEKFRYLGIIMDVRLKMEKEGANKEELLSALAPILNSKSAWKPHAQIDAALLQANTNPQKSLELLNSVADTPELPASLYERAQKLHHVISGQIPQSQPTKETDNVETN